MTKDDKVHPLNIRYTESQVTGSTTTNSNLGPFSHLTQIPPIGVVAIFTVAIFVLLKLAGFLVFQVEGNTTSTNCSSFMPAALILGAGGFGAGLAAFKLYGLWTDQQAKLVAGGVLGAFFATNLCANGTCIPSAALATIFSGIGLVPVVLGATIARLCCRPKS